METKELNLCELLKGHEGEEFYSAVHGNTRLCKIVVDKSVKFPIITEKNHIYTKDGKYYDGGECLLFPSKEQRDWGKWEEDNNIKTPKTWDELVRQKKVKNFGVNISLFCGEITKDMSNTYHDTDIENAALALLKIHQLIEVGYGGNITDEEWKDYLVCKYTIYIYADNELKIGNTVYRSHIAFHTKKQAEEFISYPENMKLVKQFYMID